MRRRRLQSRPARGCVAALVCLAASGPAPAGAEPPQARPAPALVAAAADLMFAWPDLVAGFARASGLRVTITTGSSGDLARQIAQGAPFELLMSADDEQVERLADEGVARDRGVRYATGRLALCVPSSVLPGRLGAVQDVRAALLDPRLKRLAIANPAHAPYGRAARDAMMHVGAWDRLRGSLVMGENAAQAMQFAASGSADGGLVPLSLSKAPGVASHVTCAAVPADWHAPIRQRMALMKRAGPAAEAFFAFLQGPEARAIFARHGFDAPGSE
jgi:molybdate transport system substrate-binding protein